MMMGESVHINWQVMTTAVPAFLTIVMQPFTFSISHGIYAGASGCRPPRLVCLTHNLQALHVAIRAFHSYGAASGRIGNLMSNHVVFCVNRNDVLFPPVLHDRGLHRCIKVPLEEVR
jgi:hypothetical protein